MPYKNHKNCIDCGKQISWVSSRCNLCAKINGLSGFKKGHYPYFKNKKHSQKSIQKIKLSKIGKKRQQFSDEWKNKITKNVLNYFLGKKFSVNHKKSLSKSKIGKIPWNKGKKYLQILGEKNPNWKGGITPENHRIRSNIENNLWREAVFARDNWTCQKTKNKGGKLQAHHIQNFSKFPELRFAIDNGITLSEKSHQEFHKKYGKQNNTKEQLQIFTM